MIKREDTDIITDVDIIKMREVASSLSNKKFDSEQEYYKAIAKKSGFSEDVVREYCWEYSYKVKTKKKLKSKISNLFPSRKKANSQLDEKSVDENLSSKIDIDDDVFKDLEEEKDEIEEFFDREKTSKEKIHERKTIGELIEVVNLQNEAMEEFTVIHKLLKEENQELKKQIDDLQEEGDKKDKKIESLEKQVTNLKDEINIYDGQRIARERKNDIDLQRKTFRES